MEGRQVIVEFFLETARPSAV